MSATDLINGLQGMPVHARKINADQITAPSGREVFTPSRRGYGARGGAGNALKSSKGDKTRETAKDLLTHERQVLQKHKEQATPDFKTGRGGLGAKGHVKKRGLVPNHETALAREAEVRERWNEHKEATGGGARFGRGGYNVRKSDKGDAKSTSSGSKSRSGSGREAQQGLFPTFAISEEARGRRRRFSYTHASTVRGSEYRQSTASQDTWDRVSTSDSIYDIAATTGITTTTIDPATVLDIISARPISPPYASPMESTFQDARKRTPNEVAPFFEPPSPLPSEPPISLDPPAKTPKKKQSNAFIRSLKELSLGKPKESKKENTLQPFNIGSRPPNPFHTGSELTLYPSRSSSAASFALSMVNNSHRDLSRTPAGVAPRAALKSREENVSRMSSTHASTSAASSMTSAYHYPPRMPHPYASAPTSVVMVSTTQSTFADTVSSTTVPFMIPVPQSGQLTPAPSEVSNQPQALALPVTPANPFPKPITQRRPYRPLPTPPTAPPSNTLGLPSPPNTP